jgi:hypothetical protein
MTARGSTTSYNRLMLSWSGVSHQSVKQKQIFQLSDGHVGA